MGGDIVHTRSRIYLIEVLDLKYEMISNSIFEKKKMTQSVLEFKILVFIKL